MNFFISNYKNLFFGLLSANYLPLIYLAMIWTLIWKGVALWRAARNNHHGWFIALLLINTLGILEILYIYIFSKIAKKNFSSPVK